MMGKPVKVHLIASIGGDWPKVCTTWCGKVGSSSHIGPRVPSEWDVMPTGDDRMEAVMPPEAHGEYATTCKSCLKAVEKSRRGSMADKTGMLGSGY